MGTLWFIENQKLEQLNEITEKFEDQSDEINDLREENERLKDQIDVTPDRLGSVTGVIFPLISVSNNELAQNQLVCAELVSNPDFATCVTVSPLDPQYKLNLEPGIYQVSAQIYPLRPDSETITEAKDRAYFTEYIACVQDRTEAECTDATDDPVSIEVNSGDEISDVNPVAW